MIGNNAKVIVYFGFLIDSHLRFEISYSSRTGKNCVFDGFAYVASYNW